MKKLCYILEDSSDPITVTQKAIITTKPGIYSNSFTNVRF